MVESRTPYYSAVSDKASSELETDGRKKELVQRELESGASSDNKPNKSKTNSNESIDHVIQHPPIEKFLYHPPPLEIHLPSFWPKNNRSYSVTNAPHEDGENPLSWKLLNWNLETPHKSVRTLSDHKRALILRQQQSELQEELGLPCEASEESTDSENDNLSIMIRQAKPSQHDPDDSDCGQTISEVLAEYYATQNKRWELLYLRIIRSLRQLNRPGIHLFGLGQQTVRLSKLSDGTISPRTKRFVFEKYYGTTRGDRAETVLPIQVDTNLAEILSDCVQTSQITVQSHHYHIGNTTSFLKKRQRLSSSLSLTSSGTLSVSEAMDVEEQVYAMLSSCSTPIKALTSGVIDVKPHKDERKFYCLLGCLKMAFHSEFLRSIHYHQQHYKCRYCYEKAYTDRVTLDRHVELCHARPPFQCVYCEVFYCSTNDLAKHLPVHLEYKPYTCFPCSAHFLQVIRLKQHRMSAVHKKMVQPSLVAQSNGGILYPVDLKCRSCGEHSKTNTDKEKHYRLKHDLYLCIECRHSDVCFSTSLQCTKHHQKEHYQCRYCHNHRYASGEQLRKHISERHDGPKYHCLYCTKSFGCLMELEVHVMEHPCPIDLCKHCRDCDISFESEILLEGHKREAHNILSE